MTYVLIYATVISGLLLWRSEYKLYKMNKEFERLDIRIDHFSDQLIEHIRKEKFIRLFGDDNKNDLFDYCDSIFTYSQLYELYNRRYVDTDEVTRIDISKYTKKGTK